LLLHFASIYACIRDGNLLKMISIFSSLFKENLEITIPYLQSMLSHENDLLRIAFAVGIAPILNVPQEYHDRIFTANLTLLNIFSNFELFEIVSENISTNLIENFAASVNASIILDKEFEFLERMIRSEVKKFNDTQRMIFRKEMFFVCIV
jgi:hypothetical protein